MNIAIVIYSKLPVEKYGGTERVMWALGKELAQMGHHVTFLAQNGSECPFADVVALNLQEPLTGQIPKGVDILHFNNNLFGYNCESERKVPYIITHHGNFIKGELDRNSVFVSRNHALRYGSGSFVHNGLDWSVYGEVDLNQRRSHYHFLGKAAWRLKNMTGALDVVKALPDEHLYVLGGYRLNFKMGFRFTLSRKAHFMGMIDDQTKRIVIQQSKGLIFPVKWDEPFGLAITESMYFGAPVFGTPYGSLPEIVNPEVGFLTNKKEEMVAHLIQGPSYNPKVCHEYARDLFSSHKMALEYLKKYEAVVNGEMLNDSKPRAIVADHKLPWYD